MSLDKKYKRITISKLIQEYISLTGFETPSKALYTSVKELVDNSLDACEEARVLPEIFIRILEVDPEKSIFNILVWDNGSGVPAFNIPFAFGSMLYGSKYTTKQTRGVFGIGIKNVILYGQMTAHYPTIVVSSSDGKNIYYFELLMEVSENKPHILNCRKYVANFTWRGTLVSVFIKGNYRNARHRVLEYLKNTAIANPHAHIVFIDPYGVVYEFKRGVSRVPEPPKETVYHPHGVDLEQLKEIILHSRSKDMVSFLMDNFQRIGRKRAIEILRKAGIPEDLNPKRLTISQRKALLDAFHSFKFERPQSKHLSPIGDNVLYEGIKKELSPEFIAVSARKPSSYRGHAFIVECAIAYGGEIKPKDSFKIIRYANKVPLLHSLSEDVSKKVVDEIKWGRYGVPLQAPMVIVTHVCSDKLPYRTLCKEYIADIPEIHQEIKLAILECARKLKTYLSKKKRRMTFLKKKAILEKYLSKIALFASELAERKPPKYEALIKRLEAEAIGEESGVEEEADSGQD